LVDVDWAEQKASEMRRDLHLSDYEDLDPYALAEAIEVEVLPDTWLKDVSPQIYDQIFVRDSSAWSGATLEFSNGDLKVILNHRHAKTRTKATLMEELSHVHLVHPPSLMIHDADGSFVRIYNDSHEDEAYWVGAAALATRWQLQQAQRLRHTVQSFAQFAGVSPALVRFRCRVTGIQLAEPASVTLLPRSSRLAFYAS